MTIRFLKTADGLISERYIRKLSHAEFNDTWYLHYAITASRTDQTTATPADVAAFLKGTKHMSRTDNTLCPALLPLTDITPRYATAMLATYSGRQPQMQSGIDKMSAVLRAEPGADMGYASFREGTLRNAIHRLGAIRDTGITGRMRILHDGTFDTFLQEQN